MNVEISVDTAKVIESLITQGQYPTAGAAIADGVRLLVARTQLKNEIQQGIDELDAGLGIEGTEVFANMRKRNELVGVNQ